METTGPPSARHTIISTLCNVLKNDFSSQLQSLIADSGAADHVSVLRIEASLCPAVGNLHRNSPGQPSFPLGCIDLRNGRLMVEPGPTPPITPQILSASPVTTAPPEPNHRHNHELSITETGATDDCDTRGTNKRRKVVGGLRPCISTAEAPDIDLTECESERSVEQTGRQTQASEPRQVHTDARFPQRKPRKECSVPVMQPTSTDKFVMGIWRQLYSEIQWDRTVLSVDRNMCIHGGMSLEAFRTVNVLCLQYRCQNHISRALEMVLQAYWIDCYEARIVSIRIEQPNLSSTETRMTALKEACSVLRLTEKELRNRMAIWRGYKEIKDAGGWAAIIFAGSGIYRFCKYRVGFDDNLILQLRQIRHSLEVAADTLHPGWRKLLEVIGQECPTKYPGHPHEWVTISGQPARRLTSTYDHQPGGLNYQFIDECVIDQTVFGTDDPRRMPQVDPEFCPICRQRQSNVVHWNRCNCFPTLFGCPKIPVAAQICHVSKAKNNGVVARCNFERGTAVGEFVGFVTRGVKGRDVMMGGVKNRGYQIFQGEMGNFTRFINHSCHPNSQFQKFFWQGIERIIVVSRGISSGSEITVDYSDHYWKSLDKHCLCKESCCRFPPTSDKDTGN